MKARTGSAFECMFMEQKLIEIARNGAGHLWLLYQFGAKMIPIRGQAGAKLIQIGAKLHQVGPS